MSDNTPRKKVDKVVTGNVKIKKKNSIHKLTDVFVAEDLHTVVDYVRSDLIVPTLKKLLVEIIKDGAEMIFFGNSSRSKDRRGNADTVSYRSYYGRDRREPDRFNEPSGRVRRTYDDITIPSRGEAEEVLDRMCEILDTYETVSIADFYDLVGVSGHYTDQNYGWTNLRNAEVIRTRDGYKIRLPRAVNIR